MAPDGSGSPAQWFFKRRIRNGFLTAIAKEVIAQDLMKIIAHKQLETAKKKRRISTNVFEVSDEVRIQDMTSKAWNKVEKFKLNAKLMTIKMCHLWLNWNQGVKQYAIGVK